MGVVEVGLRVVRGPDWRWEDQDGGEGHAGTIVEVGKPGSSTTPDRTVVVQWDGGSRTNYRTGYQNAHDLRLIDNAPAGVKHPNHICDGCKKQGISGIRWKCGKCFDYDLCTLCYMADKHDLSHPFLRYEISSSQGIEVGQRRGLPKIACQGIFPGAKVIRGQDWDWGNQDGGQGKCGRVIEIRGWDNESGRSVASVTWVCGTNNVYRVGHKGKMDIKYILPATHGYLYMQQLPVVGKIEEGATSLVYTADPQASVYSPFFVGERVRVSETVESLRTMQEGHGGWNQKMAEIIDKVGVVHRITDKGDVRVQYDNFPNRWTLHPRSLTRVHLFAIGDVVTVISDPVKMKELQKDHGEWVDMMRSLCDKSGIISKVYGDADLRVDIGEKVWTLNPLCVNYSPRQNNYSNTMKANERVDQAGPSVSHFGATLSGGNSSSLIDQLVREAAQGHQEIVVNILTTNPEIVDGRSAGKTAMQVSCHQGHLELVKKLISFKASLKLADEDGDTPLHYTAFGNQPEIMEVLLSKGAEIDAINKGRCSALHVAVNKQHVFCVKLLLRCKCDVNIQDSYGDTALHDAIGKDSVEILEMLGNSTRLNLILRNKRGFNVLHHAALKGNNFVTEKLVERARQFVDIRKDDGFAALHLAALNGHKQVAETLLTIGRADANLTNNKRQTPLLLAVSQGHFEVLEVLVQHSADVNAADEDGETALHLALQRQISNPTASPQLTPTFMKIVNDLTSVGLEGDLSMAMACYLLQKSANITAVNSKRKTPLDFVSNTAAVDVLQNYTDMSNAPESNASRLDMDMRALDLAAESLRSESAQIENASAASRLSLSTPCSPAHKPNKTSPSPATEPSCESQAEEATETTNCNICLENAAVVVFKPCEHTITCEDCAHRLKKCLLCQQVIVSKVTNDGRVVCGKVRPPSADRLRYLESKIAEIEEAHSCSICMERRRSVVFLCGHGACVVCATPLKACHMCRRPITKKINVY